MVRALIVSWPKWVFHDHRWKRQRAPRKEQLLAPPSCWDGSNKDFAMSISYNSARIIIKCSTWALEVAAVNQTSCTLLYFHTMASDKKEAKRTAASVLRGGWFVSTIFIQLLKTSSLSKDSVIGFIQIRTGALLERLRRWPQDCWTPALPFQICRFDRNMVISLDIYIHQ